MRKHPNKNLSVAESGALAASLLKSACTSALESGGSLQLEVVRDLAKDLESSLGEILGTTARNTPLADLLTEAALQCADLANLAACNVSQLPEEHRPQAIAAVHLASGTIKALDVLAEAGGPGPSDPADVSRDLRSAGWRADLAVRQV